MQTGFGFFPAATFENQAGLSTTAEQSAELGAASDFLVDLTARPARFFQGSLRLAESRLLMLDRVTACDPRGGRAGLGFLRAEKTVNPAEWFFKAHFFQDPVQPGSLGLEAMLQLLQFHMLQAGLAQGMSRPRFAPIEVGRALTLEVSRPGGATESLDHCHHGDYRARSRRHRAFRCCRRIPLGGRQAHLSGGGTGNENRGRGDRWAGPRCD